MAVQIIDHLTTRLSFLFDGNKGVQAAVNGFKRMDRQWQDTVKSITKGATIMGAALTGVGAVVIKATVPYEQALNDLRAFADLTEKELANLDTVARDIGSSGRFGAKEVLEGQKEFLRNQFSVNETLAATPHLERLATAGMMDMDKAANLVAHTLRRFDLGADQAQHVTDVLAAMTQETGLNLGDLEATFRRAALVADRLNMSFEDTAASVSILAREGLRPREAGSLLEAMLEDLTELSEESKEAAAELSRVGLDMDFVQGLASEGQITKLFDELRLAGADINKIFSTEGIDAAQILFAAGDEFAQLADQYLTSVKGRSREMAETRNLGLPGAIEDIKSAVNAFQLSVGTSGLSGMLEWVFDKLAAFVRWLSEASGWVKGLAVAAIAAGPVLLGLAAAVKVASFAKSGFAVAVSIARGAVWLWNNAMVVTRIRLGLLTVQTWLANFSLVTFGRTVWTSSIAALRGLVTNLGRASLGMLRFALKAIVAGISGVIAFGVALWASMIPPLIAATAAVTAFTVALLANPVVLVIIAIIGAFVALGFVVYKFRRQILGALKAVWKWVKGNWPLLVGILLGPFGIAGALIWKFRDQILGAFQDVWDWLRESPIFGPVIDGIQAIIDFVRELPGRVLGILKDIPGMVADAMGHTGAWWRDQGVYGDCGQD